MSAVVRKQNTFTRYDRKTEENQENPSELLWSQSSNLVPSEHKVGVPATTDSILVTMQVVHPASSTATFVSININDTEMLD